MYEFSVCIKFVGIEINTDKPSLAHLLLTQVLVLASAKPLAAVSPVQGGSSSAVPMSSALLLWAGVLPTEIDCLGPACVLGPRVFWLILAPGLC